MSVRKNTKLDSEAAFDLLIKKRERLLPFV